MSVSNTDDKKKISISLKLDDKHLQIFNKIKRDRNIKVNTEVIKYIILEYDKLLPKTQSSRY